MNSFERFSLLETFVLTKAAATPAAGPGFVDSISNAGTALKDLAGQGLSSAGAGLKQVGSEVGNIGSAVGDSLSENPWGGAAVGGTALAGLLALAHHNKLKRKARLADRLMAEQAATA